jgi:hypothetical protein
VASARPSQSARSCPLRSLIISAKVRTHVTTLSSSGQRASKFPESGGAVLVEVVGMAGQQSCRLADGRFLGHGRRGPAAGAEGLRVAADGALAAVTAHAADLPAEPDGVA